ncbi:SRPBCC domain-containing protein [Celeribacter indicus]|uniref:Activator of Hsp90 ATPase homologue 1/2-like C-terminal domain-containing protein n=1 Tax=Celeribacter indicus TaxID=1208324 RepID=A0A0B5DSU5_9RHOB|nr:SRPBCC domain-containing protein [Celeribacter indicus]AJE46119.1 hypothetical protein P73_1404 [Celeribacter indicus]SDX37562.1 Uncharacterized conserved protein YndB, AHSA1/START domain [Celeribacter indicus]
MTRQEITVEVAVAAPVARVWDAYTRPEDIMQWNAASDDWHTPAASVDLREGGAFCAPMEAKDGSTGFDFAGTYTRIEPHRRIEYEFGGRHAAVDFLPEDGRLRLRVTFDAETGTPVEQQRAGWQAILDRFRRHVDR